MKCVLPIGYMAIFFNFAPTTRRLVVGADDNGKFRLERVLIKMRSGLIIFNVQIKSIDSFSIPSNKEI